MPHEPRCYPAYSTHYVDFIIGAAQDEGRLVCSWPRPSVLPWWGGEEEDFIEPEDGRIYLAYMYIYIQEHVAYFSCCGWLLLILYYYYYNLVDGWVHCFFVWFFVVISIRTIPVPIRLERRLVAIHA